MLKSGFMFYETKVRFQCLHHISFLHKGNCNINKLWRQKDAERYVKKKILYVARKYFMALFL